MDQETSWAIGLAALLVVFLLHAFIWRIYRLWSRLWDRLLPWLFGKREDERIGSVVELVDGWLGKWPRLQRVLSARLNPSEFTGLPLAIAVLAALYLAMLFGDTVEELFEADEMLALDHWVQDRLVIMRSGWMVALFTWLTGFGESQVLIAVALSATGFLWVLGRRYAVLPLWLVVLGANATTWIGKYAIQRSRPEFVTDVSAISPSFPSGHATGAMALYGFLAFLVARDLAEPRQRFEVLFWSSVLILLVGASRVILSVHFLSDVVAGFLVGGFWILVGYALSEYRRRQYIGEGSRSEES